MAAIEITEYTDPGCPFAWSAEPARRRLEWVFGDQLRWSLRMVGLRDVDAESSPGGFTPERQASAFHALAKRYHMPIDTSVRSRLSATVPACRAVVAVRLNEPARERSLLRALRVSNFSGSLLDDPETILAAASEAELDPAKLQQWMSGERTETALREDFAMARAPSATAVSMNHKLASWNGGWRYTCPSYEIDAGDGRTFAAPGIQPADVYEVAISNLNPSAHRRPSPSDVREVLQWADEPLATAEVAALCQMELEQARQALARTATERPLGWDGLWRL